MSSPWSLRRSRSVWASTNRTSGWSSTTPSPSRWKATTKKQAGPAETDLPSDCVLFYSYSDKSKQEFFINRMEDDIERQKASAKLTQVIDYCQLQTCRRRYLLDYFGDETVSNGAVAGQLPRL